MDIAPPPPPGPKNLRLSQTVKGPEEERWYILDNAAILMPGVADSTVTLVFRISATLREVIRLPELVRALENVAPRFPYYLVELRRGFFWYYLQPLEDRLPAVSADSKFPCLKMRPRGRGRYLFRVRAYGSRVAVEFCHVLTDGSGALAFLRALVAEYFRLRGVQVPDPGDLILAGSAVDHEETEDAFNRYFRERIPFPEAGKRAFHFPARALPAGQYRVTTGILSLPAAIERAKSRGATLTEYLVAVYFAALQEIYLGLPASVRKLSPPRISVEVPVNLRRIFPSKTLRNFSLYVIPSLDMRLGAYTFAEIVKRVHLFMQAEVNDKSMAMQIARNVGSGRNIFIRILPLVLKDLAARQVYKRMGEDIISGFISNLGAVSLPAPLDGLVERFEFIPAPSRRCKTNANVLSFGGNLYVSFGSTAATTELERLFFSRLVSEGLAVKVEANV